MADPIITPRRREDFFDRNGDPTLRFIRWIELVTGQTNTTTTNVQDTSDSLVSTSSRVSRDASKINALELKEFEIVNVTGDITTKRNQILICKNLAAINITLDPQAVEGDELHIKRRGEEITEIGTIDGLTNRTINVLQWSDHLVFDGIDWSVI